MSIFTTIRNALRRIFHRSRPDDCIGNPIPAPLPWAPPPMPTRPPMPPVKPAKASTELPPSVARSVEIGEAIGSGLAAGIEASPVTLYANDQIVAVVKETMGIPENYALPEAREEWQCVSQSLQAAASAVDEAAKAYISFIRAIRDADLIGRYGTPKEIHYIVHGRKARTWKKYRNRVLRRVRRAERRNARENRTPRA